jgi:hypothetical protein
VARVQVSGTQQQGSLRKRCHNSATVKAVRARARTHIKRDDVAESGGTGMPPVRLLPRTSKRLSRQRHRTATDCEDSCRQPHCRMDSTHVKLVDHAREAGRLPRS